MRKIGILFLTVILLGTFSTFILATPMEPEGDKDTASHAVTLNIASNICDVSIPDYASSPTSGNFTGPNKSVLKFDNLVKVRAVCTSNWDLGVNIGEDGYSYTTDIASATAPSIGQFVQYTYGRFGGMSWGHINGGGEWKLSGDPATYKVLASGSNNAGSPFVKWMDFKIDMASAAGSVNFPSGQVGLTLEFLLVETA